MTKNIIRKKQLQRVFLLLSSSIVWNEQITLIHFIHVIDTNCAKWLWNQPMDFIYLFMELHKNCDDRIREKETERVGERWNSLHFTEFLWQFLVHFALIPFHFHPHIIKYYFVIDFIFVLLCLQYDTQIYNWRWPAMIRIHSYLIAISVIRALRFNLRWKIQNND